MGERTRSRIGTTEGVKISIIIPAYNVAPYLRACLDSVLAQGFENWECVVVDDESTDESPRILDEYAARDVRIRVIHQKNKGEGGARNSGIAAARGEWVFFLDGDDVMASGALKQLAQIIDRHPDVKLIRFGFEQFEDGTGWAAQHVGENLIRKDISREIRMSDFLTYVWQHLYRRDVVEEMLFKGYRRGCDRVFVDDVLLNKVDSFVETDAVLYGYRVRAGSAMNSVPSAPVIEDQIHHRMDILRMIEEGHKVVKYAGSQWLEGYFTKEFGALVSGKTKEEQSRLWAEWHRCIRWMKELKGVSARTRLIYRVCCALPWRPVWWLLCRAWPWYCLHGLVPRAYRWGARHLV